MLPLPLALLFFLVSAAVVVFMAILFAGIPCFFDFWFTGTLLYFFRSFFLLFLDTFYFSGIQIIGSSFTACLQYLSTACSCLYQLCVFPSEIFVFIFCSGVSFSGTACFCDIFSSGAISSDAFSSGALPSGAFSLTVFAFGAFSLTVFSLGSLLFDSFYFG